MSFKWWPDEWLSLSEQRAADEEFAREFEAAVSAFVRQIEAAPVKGEMPSKHITIHWVSPNSAITAAPPAAACCTETETITAPKRRPL